MVNTHHVFAALAAVAISAPATAQVPDQNRAQSRSPGWIADANNGCKVRNPAPAANETVTWSGSCVGGVAQGAGVEQWYTNGVPGNRLEGAFRDGSPVGQVTVNYPGGHKYMGELSADGHRSGRGTMIYASGSQYVGEWSSSRYNGQGTVTYATGTTYIGEWRDGKPDGNGVYTNPKGAKYAGEFRQGKFDGQGTLTYESGEKYLGEFRNGKPTGRGTIYLADGSLATSSALPDLDAALLGASTSSTHTFIIDDKMMTCTTFGDITDCF